MALFDRQENPPHYQDHREYRPFLRKDFQRRCAYCDRTEGYLGGQEAFEIDHFKPRQKFPELRSKYANLYYACRRCNLNKSSIWPSEDRAKHGYVFADPCVEDPYLVHLQEKPDGTLDELTPCGDFTNGHIRLDRPELCEWRRQRRQARIDLPKWESFEDTLLHALDVARSVGERVEIEQKINMLRGLISELQIRFLI